MKEGPFTLSELAEVTGATRRALQFWTDRAVIFAEEGTEKAGRGTHRRYNVSEAAIACVVRALAQHHISVGELEKISTSLRKNLKSDELYRIRFFSGLINREPVFFAAYVFDDSWRTMVVEQDKTGNLDFFYFYNNSEIEGSAPAFNDVMHQEDNMMIIIRLNNYLSGLR